MCGVITDRVTLRHGLHEVTRRYIDTQRRVVLFTTQVIFWYYLMTWNTMLWRRHAKYLILATTHTVFWFLVGLLFHTVWCVLFVAYVITGAVSRGHVLMYGIMTFHDQNIIYMLTYGEGYVYITHVSQAGDITTKIRTCIVVNKTVLYTVLKVF